RRRSTRASVARGQFAWSSAAAAGSAIRLDRSWCDDRRRPAAVKAEALPNPNNAPQQRETVQKRTQTSEAPWHSFAIEPIYKQASMTRPHLMSLATAVPRVISDQV